MTSISWVLSIFLIPILISMSGLVYSIRENRIENKETQPVKAITAPVKDWIQIDKWCWDVYIGYMESLRLITDENLLEICYKDFSEWFDGALDGIEPDKWFPDKKEVGKALDNISVTASDTMLELEAATAALKKQMMLIKKGPVEDPPGKRKLISWEEHPDPEIGHKSYSFKYDDGTHEGMRLNMDDPFSLRLLEEYISTQYKYPHLYSTPSGPYMDERVNKPEVYSVKHGKYLSELECPPCKDDPKTGKSWGYEIVSIYRCNYCNIKWSQRDENTPDYERCLRCRRYTAPSELVTRSS